MCKLNAGTSCPITPLLSFGRTVMDKNKHKNIKYGNEAKYNECKNKWNFHDADKYDDVYEIMISKKSVRQNMSLQIGYSVFDDFKLKMYQFYYDCVDKYLDRSDFQYIGTDTDSAYMALAGNFEDSIKPELRETFELD